MTKTRILLVDDLPDSLALLSKALSRLMPEAELLSAFSGPEAIDIAQREALDLVLLDARMPQMDGFETCRRLKSDYHSAHVPVLMVSGVLVDVKDRISGLECGADGYLCKPFEPQELISQVKALLRMKRVEDELRLRESSLEHELADRTKHLVESEERFRVLFDRSPDAVFVEDEHGVVLDVNPAACRMHQLGREQLVGRKAWDLVPPSSRGTVLHEFKKWFTGELTSFEGFSLRHDGTAVPVEIRGNPIIYDGRQALLLHVRDESHRHAAERALQVSEARYRAIVEDQTEMISRYLPDGTTTFVNESACRFLGLPREQIIGKSHHHRIPEAERPAVLSRLAALTPDKPLAVIENRFETTPGILRWTQWSNRGIFDESGRLIEIQSVGRDITEQKESERRNQATTAGLRAVMEMADELISCPDLDTLYQRAVELARERLRLDRCGLLIEDDGEVRGTFGTDMQGRTTDERSHRVPVDALWRERFRLRQSHEPRYDVERETYREWTGADMAPLRESGWVAVTPIQTARQSLGLLSNDTARTRAPLDPVQQEVASVFCSLLAHIIERKKTENKLLQAQKMEGIGRLAGGIAHDFNNLLTAILGFARLTHQNLPSDSPLRHDVQEIMNAGDRAAKLTKQLLALGRKQVVQVQPIDVNSVVLHMDQLLRRTLGEDVELVTTCAEGLGTVRADAGLLEQVIMNLAVNARDAMPQGGKLFIATAGVELDEAFCRSRDQVSPGPYVELKVRDTGSGMSAQVLEHVFEPFFTTKDQGKGSGLGLSSVYGIITQLGGLVEVDSEVNVGTEFRILLPQGREQALPPPAAAPESAATGDETILLVEDEPTVRDFTKRILMSLGYRVLEASHGEDALRIFHQHQTSIQLVLSDVVMPFMGGADLARELRRRNAATRILLMTGFADKNLPSEGLAGGRIAILQKPFNRESLSRAVRRTLDAGAPVA